MKIIKAKKYHKDHVLKLLDDFRTCCLAIMKPEEKIISQSAKKSGGAVFDKTIASPAAAIFLAQEKKQYIGIATVYKIPQIRNGGYCAEIEDLYVAPEYQGKGVAQLLMRAVFKWAKKNNIKTIRLESSRELKRAHGFYEKTGFRHYGRAYIKNR